MEPYQWVLYTSFKTKLRTMEFKALITKNIYLCSIDKVFKSCTRHTLVIKQF
jgi:hypothetical protein